MKLSEEIQKVKDNFPFKPATGVYYKNDTYCVLGAVMKHNNTLIENGKDNTGWVNYFVLKNMFPNYDRDDFGEIEIIWDVEQDIDKCIAKAKELELKQLNHVGSPLS